MRWSLVRSLQIGSLLIGCVTAQLARADDPPAPQSAASAAESAAEQADQPLTREVLTELIREKRYEEAVGRLEQAIAAAPDDRSLGLMYSHFSGAVGRDPSDAALSALSQIVDSALAKPSLEPAAAIGVATAADQLVMRDTQLSPDEKLELLDRLDQKMASDQPSLAMAKRTIQLRRITTLIAAERKDEAQAMLAEMVDAARMTADPADSSSVRRFVDAVTTYQMIAGRHFPEQAEELVKQAETLSAQAMAQDEIDMTTVIAFFSIRQSRAASLARSQPEAAAEIIEELEEALESARERLDRASLSALTTYTRTLASLRSRIDAALKISAIIGTEAPEIDAESFIATDPVTMQDLRGKVVLVDFWAVWCGPCIRTFPHLIQWHEKYADRGLVILGATRHYGYRWDDPSQRAVQGTDVSPEEELEMLEKFRESHQLRHGFFVTPQGSDYQAAFSVTGIPHAVLIDQEGKIQMVRIGSGDANARDLEEKIEQLLATES